MLGVTLEAQRGGDPLTSAYGTSATFKQRSSMSAFEPFSDISA